MTDAVVANVARRLAEALRDYAYNRKDEDKKLVAELQTELVRTVRTEFESESKSESNA